MLNYIIFNKIKFSINILLIIIVTIFVVQKSFSTSLEYDDAYNASVAKNISLGYGYVTSYDKVILFNPEVTTGPAIIIPASLMIKMFGNKYWVPSLTVAIINISLLLLIYLSLKCLIKNANSSYSVDTSFTFMLISIVIITFLGQSSLWHTFVGELPLVLMVVLGSIFLIDLESYSKIIISGFIFGFAILTKSIALFSVASAAVYIFLYINASSFRSKCLRLMIFLSTIFLVNVSWSIYKYYSIPLLSDLLDLKRKERIFFFDKGSGVGQFYFSKDKIFHVISLLKSNVGTLSSYFDDCWRIIVILSVVLLATCIIFIHNQKYKLNSITFILIVTGIVHIYWWLFMSPFGWIRHLYPGIMYLFIFLALIIAQFDVIKRVAFVCIIVIIMLPAIKNMNQLFLVHKKTDRLNAQLQTVDYINNVVKSNNKVVMFGSGWWANRDLEYLLPTVCNFTDIDKHKFNVKPDIVKPLYLLVRSNYWYSENTLEFNVMESKCNYKTLYQNKPYKIGIINI